MESGQAVVPLGNEAWGPRATPAGAATSIGAADGDQAQGEGGPLPESPSGDDGPATPRSAVRLVPDAKLDAQAEQRRALLAAMAPDAAPDERVLLELAGDELKLFDVLRDAQLQAALRVVVLVDNPTMALALTKALKNTADVANSVARRVRESLQAASALRAQRRLTRDSGGLHGD